MLSPFHVKRRYVVSKASDRPQVPFSRPVFGRFLTFVSGILSTPVAGGQCTGG